MAEHFFSILPADKLVAIEEALLNTFETTHVSSFSILAGGLSAAATYRIVVKDKFYVLKLANQTANEEFGVTNLFLAAQAGIAPPLYFEDPKDGISISAYITAQPLRSFFRPEELTKELALVTQRMHAIKPNAKGPDLLKTIDSLIEEFRQSQMLTGNVFDNCFEKYEALKVLPELRKDHDLVFSHNDLNPNNLLCDGRLWIIDWDASYQNDRYVDLANLANFFVHTEAQEHAFLHAYFNEAPNSYQKSRLFTMRQLCRLIYAFMMFQLARQAKPAGYPHNQQLEGIDLHSVFTQIGNGNLSLATYEGQLLYGKALLNEAVGQMNSPRWLASIERLG